MQGSRRGTKAKNAHIRWLVRAAASALMCSAIVMPAPVAAQSAAANIDIRAQSLAQALMQLARQANVNIVAPSELTRGRRAPAVRGTMSVDQALTRLLAGSGLVHRLNSGGSIIIERGSGTTSSVRAASEVASADATQTGVAEILVVGSRSQNVDVRRTEDDPQPYVVFDRRDIENSSAGNLEEFFRSRLPQNTQPGLSRQAANPQSPSDTINSNNVSEINLRGLGATQTLILIDGRRAPRVLGSGGARFTQADINGIPLGAIERIEVLPSTAGGIYGGGAVGGVINIVRRRDYRGVQLQLDYDGTFRGGGETFRISATGGFMLEGGNTEVSFALSHAASTPLYVGDNDLWRRSRALSTSASGVGTLGFAGQTPNIQAQSAFQIVPVGTPGCTPVGTFCLLTVRPNLVLDPALGGTPLGSSFTSVPIGYAGPQSDNGAGLVSNAGRYNLDLSNDVRGRFATLLNNPRVRSASFNIRRSFGAGLDIFADFFVNDNLARSRSAPTGVGVISLPAAAPNNPFQQGILVYYPILDFGRDRVSRSLAYGGTTGLIARLAPRWSMSAEYSWSRSRATDTYSSLAISPQGTAALGSTISLLRDLEAFPLDLSAFELPAPDSFAGPYRNTQQVASVRASGTIFELPGGDMNLTVLGERRNEAAARAELLLPDSRTIYPRRSQSVTSGYAEVTAPLVSERNAMTLVRSLEIQASVRYDQYRTRVATPLNAVLRPPSAPEPNFQSVSSSTDSTDFTLAALWSPVDGLRFRASYATGFLPPAINQLSPNLINGSTTNGFRDPRRGNELIGTAAPFTIQNGGSLELDPERSKSFSVGVIFSPRFIPGLRISADYVDIRKTDEIGILTEAFLLANEDLYPGRVVRAPNVPGDPPGIPGPITALDAGLINVARSRARALDLQAEYRFSPVDDWTIRLHGAATRQFARERQSLPNSATFDGVGFFDGPLRWRGNAGVDISYRSLSLFWSTQYYDGYSVRLSSAPDVATNDSIFGRSRIPSQFYSDLSLRYRVPGSLPQPFAGLDVLVGVQNLFDRRPPALGNALIGYSPYGDPRLRRFTLSLRREFN